MVSAFESFRRLGPAAFVLKAIVSMIVADVLLLGFILLRRTYRKRYFARRDARQFGDLVPTRLRIVSSCDHASMNKTGSSCA